MAIYSFTFSPTGTSAAIARAISEGITQSAGKAVTFSDLTSGGAGELSFGSDDLVLVTAPVYGGKITPMIKRRLEGVEGGGARCVVVAVYGNRAFEHAAADIAGFMTESGFRVCGAGAFVGEHSYSTPSAPIAEGRPDSLDLSDARTFGSQIAARMIDDTLAEVDLSLLADEPSPAEALDNFRTFVMEYQRQQAQERVVYLPEVDPTVCDDCGGCYAVCPTGAITPGSHEADPALCIKCCACVKSCPQGARSFRSPFAPVLSANFAQRKSPRWII